MEKQMGIEMNMIFCHAEDKDLTEQDLDSILDAVIDEVEHRGWFCGGGVRLVDVNADD